MFCVVMYSWARQELVTTCIVWYFTIDKRFQKTRQSGHRTLMWRLINISLLQPEPKRLKQHQNLSCEEQVRAEIFPGIFQTISVSLPFHICGTSMCLGTVNSVMFQWKRLYGFTSAIMTSKPRLQILIGLNQLS